MNNATATSHLRGSEEFFTEIARLVPEEGSCQDLVPDDLWHQTDDFCGKLL
jgi:hypothetical protein